MTLLSRILPDVDPNQGSRSRAAKDWTMTIRRQLA
jgi:hypothetical protein